MQKKTLFIILALVILIAGAIYLFNLNKDGCSTEEIETEDGSCVNKSYFENGHSKPKESKCQILDDGRKACYLGSVNIKNGTIVEEETTITN